MKRKMLFSENWECRTVGRVGWFRYGEWEGSFIHVILAKQNWLNGIGDTDGDTLPLASLSPHHMNIICPVSLSAPSFFHWSLDTFSESAQSCPSNHGSIVYAVSIVHGVNSSSPFLHHDLWQKAAAWECAGSEIGKSDRLYLHHLLQTMIASHSSNNEDIICCTMCHCSFCDLN